MRTLNPSCKALEGFKFNTLRNYEENNVEYSETSLWNALFGTKKPGFYKRFGLDMEEIKIFALTGLLPHRFQGINFRL